MNKGGLTATSVWGGVRVVTLDYGFNRWANERILKQVALLNEEELMAPDKMTHGSAFQMLLHMLDSEWGWRIICEEGVQTPLLWEVESIPDLNRLAQFWRTEADRMSAYLQSLTDVDLDRTIDIGLIFGDQSRKAKVLHLIKHILYHSANHRSELAVYLTGCGHSPGDMDFLDYLAKSTV